MRIERIAISDFSPFGNANIHFPVSGSDSAEVHFFVGPNGTGKTRLLSLLLAALGNRNELSLRTDGTTKSAVLAVGDNQQKAVYKDSHLKTFWGHPSHAEADCDTELFPLPNGPKHGSGGLLGGDVQADLSPTTATLGLAFKGASAEISDSDVSALAPVSLGNPSTHLQFGRSPEEDKIVGQSMVNVKMSAAMDQLQAEGSFGRGTMLSQRLEHSVTQITGRKFCFRVTPHPKKNVSLKVDWGKDKGLRLVQLPDGLRAIIGWLVSCIAKIEASNPDEQRPLDSPVILVIDEPEGHLHPEWQRQVLPAIQSLLPNAQIFVATHSPWIISSVNEGWIHVLKTDNEGKVTVEPPIECSRGDSYIEVVEDILGVMERYDPETEVLLERFRGLRKRVKSGEKEHEPELRKLAKEIGDRSESLAAMMGREIWQLDQQLELASKL